MERLDLLLQATAKLSVSVLVDDDESELPR
jgi:hypothetical protein